MLSLVEAASPVAEEKKTRHPAGVKSEKRTIMAKLLTLSASGLALAAILSEVNAAKGGEVFMTAADAQEGISSGFLVADTARAEGDLAPVQLTDAGRAQLSGGQPASTGATVTRGGFEIEDAVPVPSNEGARRGREGGYPFDKLEIGQSFHVAKTAENETPADRLASSVSGARARFAEQDGDKTEEVTVKEYQREADGKTYSKDAEGKRIVTGERKETRPVMKLTRDFIVRAVDATDPKGEGARVWRVALEG